MYYPKTHDQATAPPMFEAPPPATGIPIPMQTTRTRKSETWNSGLCGCCNDCKICCLTLWCPCVAFGRIAHNVDKGLTSCGGAGSLCCFLALCVGFQWVYTCIYRRNLRMNYNLPETPCCDCCVEYCCECCSLCQMYRELESRGHDLSLGYNQSKERADMEPPTMQGGMMH